MVTIRSDKNDVCVHFITVKEKQSKENIVSISPSKASLSVKEQYRYCLEST
jgi:hypothetical protein